jgi:hypothetical protein
MLRVKSQKSSWSKKMELRAQHKAAKELQQKLKDEDKAKKEVCVYLTQILYVMLHAH